MRVGPFEMLHIPGHCPGHVAIRLQDVVFSGDHILTGIIPHQSPEALIPYAGLGHYLDSLQKLEDWAGDVRLVFGGHGEPMTDLPGHIHAIQDAIAEKLDQALDFLVEPHTIADVTAHLYPDQQGYNGLLVLEKTGAFVEYLYQRGLLEIVNYSQLESGQPVVLHYHRTKPYPFQSLEKENEQEEHPGRYGEDQESSGVSRPCLGLAHEVDASAHPFTCRLEDEGRAVRHP